MHITVYLGASRGNDPALERAVRELGAEVLPGCVDRDNRYHVLIRLDMDPAALTAYDASAMHHRWKDRFGPLLEKKAIFDYEP